MRYAKFLRHRRSTGLLLGWCLVAVFFGLPTGALAAVDSVYQWAVAVAPTSDQGNRAPARAYLWIPEIASA